MAEKVVCVNGKAPPEGWGPSDPVVRGETYTIRGTHKDGFGRAGFLLFEAATYEIFPNGAERGYLASRFRSVKKYEERLSVFRRMNAPRKEKELVEVRIR